MVVFKVCPKCNKRWSECRCYDVDEKDEEIIVTDLVKFEVNRSDDSDLRAQKITMDFPSSLAIYIPMQIYYKLFAYIRSTKEEISGMGFIEREGNVITITDFFLLEQKNCGSTTKIDMDSLAKLQYDMMKAKKDIAAMRVWWHSHADMDAFWSGTDDTTCNDFNNGDYLISLVGTRDGQLVARMDIYKPFRLTLYNLPIKVLINEGSTKTLINKCKAEVKEKVKDEEKECTVWCNKCGCLKQYCTCEEEEREAKARKKKLYKFKKGHKKVIPGCEDETFICGGIEWVWNQEEQCYAFYDPNTGAEISEEEAKERGAFGYVDK